MNNNNRQTNTEYNRKLNLEPLSDEEALAQYKTGLDASLEGQGEEEEEEVDNG